MEEHGLVKEETTQLFFNSSECYVCQGRFGFIPADKGMRFTASTECPYPGGIPDYDVLLGVPSGKIVFANDLRPLVEIEEPRGTTVNSMIGQRRHTEAHAAAGLILISTGNTGPGVWKRPDGTLSVANFRERDPEWGEEGVVTPVEERGEHLGDIDTELWDFSAMDHDHFMERCVALQEYPASFGITVVDVQPGTWAFTVPQNTGRDTATEIFSNARWTDLEAPVVHVIDTSVAASLEESHAWKTLTDAWSYGFSENGYKTLEYLLIVIGNGYDWTDGLLRSGTRREDAPFRSLNDKMLDQPLSVHPLDGEIPVWPNFAYPIAESAFEKMRVVSTMYPLSLDYARAAIIPANADPHWLAVTTMYVKAMKDRVDLFSDQHSDPKKNQDGMNLIYGMLLDLIEQRGIETMRPYFAEWLAKDAELLEKNPPQ
ncbi:MAG: hypothetical protein EOP83_16005 [Verrucomicrobiaceae bacterium]|nr:MAG: hypothetical protein EOP83_16005 [Verrucomicrobiaceae bacterium]